MRKYLVILIVSAMALLTGCHSNKEVTSNSSEANDTQKPASTAETALLKNTGTNGVMSYILFDVDSKTLTEEESMRLDMLADEINSMGSCEVTVIGHTDNIGTFEVNKAVSIQRARLVADYLKKKGVNNITARGESYNYPVGGNDTAAGRAKNRRVEIFVSTIGKYNPYKN